MLVLAFLLVSLLAEKYETVCGEEGASGAMEVLFVALSLLLLKKSQPSVCGEFPEYFSAILPVIHY